MRVFIIKCIGFYMTCRDIFYNYFYFKRFSPIIWNKIAIGFVLLFIRPKFAAF